MRELTAGEKVILRDLDPHTRLHALCLLAAVPDLRVTSGRRSPERNRAVGGVKGSWHLKGRAVDFGGSPEDERRGLAFARAQRVSPGCTGPEEALVHDSGNGEHLHVAW